MRKLIEAVAPKSDRPDLLTCPFCGSVPHFQRGQHGDEHIQCSNHSGSCLQPSVDCPDGDAAHFWNMRAPAVAAPVSEALTEDDGHYRDDYSNFPAPIAAALTDIESGFIVLSDAVEAEATRLTREMSFKWPDCAVALFQGHGMTSVEIVITPALAGKCEHDEGFYDALHDQVSQFVDTDSNPVHVLFDELESLHRNAVPEFGFVGFVNGKPVESNVVEYMRNALPQQYRRFGL